MSLVNHFLMLGEMVIFLVGATVSSQNEIYEVSTSVSDLIAYLIGSDSLTFSLVKPVSKIIKEQGMQLRQKFMLDVILVLMLLNAGLLCFCCGFKVFSPCDTEMFVKIEKPPWWNDKTRLCQFVLSTGYV